MKIIYLTALFTGALAAAAESAKPTAGDSASPEKVFAVRFTLGPGWDAAKTFQEQTHIAEHSANLMRLHAEGIALSGGRLGDTGLVLVRAPDETAVRAQLARDPSLGAGTFRAAIDEYQPFFRGAGLPRPDSPEVTVVRASIAAFNAHNPDAVAAQLADDVKFLSLAGDAPSIDGDGRGAIRTWLVTYFKSLPDVRSEISDVTQSGAHVSFRERSTWTAKNGTRRAQTALAVYEVRDGKIKRAWYFPATREPAPATKPEPTPSR